MIIESLKWIQVSQTFEMDKLFPEELEPLKYTNLYLLIALSCISFLAIPVTFYSAIKVAKDFGWDVYKKIGSSIKIQGKLYFSFYLLHKTNTSYDSHIGMYITVQWFSLALKIDIYFEFCAYGLYVIALAFNFEDDPDFYFVFSIVLVMTILTIPSLVFSRCAISKENKTMMILFILYQATCIGCVGYILLLIKGMLITWYAFTGFCKDL